MKYAVLTLPWSSEAPRYSDRRAASLGHPIYAWLGLRPILAQHTAAEHATIERWARGRSSLVEIGVAEGVSALALRQSMAANGTLYLIDPFHSSRVPLFNFTRRAAHRAVSSWRRGKTVWIQKFSSDAVRGWNAPIDLLFIDGDHTEAGARADWEGWNRFVEPGGIVIFHDARVFEGGWADANYGPVKLVNELFRQKQTTGWRMVEEVDSMVVVEKLK